MTAEPVFALDRVTFRHPGGIAALEEVSFAVRPGESVAVLGANGCGKSTLLRLLDGLALAQAGEARAFGRPLVAATLEDRAFSRELRKRVALLFQDPDVQLFSPTVLDEVAFGPLELGLDPREVEERARETLALLGVERLAGRAPGSLSGGEKKKVALAALLATDPAVLLLDEPFTGLDPRSQVWLVELLQALRARGKTLVTATHDLSFAEEVTDRALVLGEDHRLAADGPVGAVLRDTPLLLRVNLIHEHAHRHGATVHVHAHSHGHGHDHDHGHDHGPDHGS